MENKYTCLLQHRTLLANGGHQIDRSNQRLTGGMAVEEGTLLPLVLNASSGGSGPGTFTMPLFALDFAKFTICVLLPLVNMRPMTAGSPKPTFCPLLRVYGA